MKRPALKISFLHLFSTIAFLIMAFNAFAINISPYSLYPGLVGKTIYRQQTMSASTSPSVGIPSAKPSTDQSAIAAGEDIKFVLHRVMINGNYVVSTQTILAQFEPYLHKEISLAKLQSLVNEVTSVYQKEGYFLSKAYLPPQEINDGVVKVTIAEGFVSAVVFKGGDKSQEKILQPYVDAVKAQQPSQLAEVEKRLLLMNDIPGIQVQSVFSEDKKTPLGATMTLFVKYTPVNGSITYDNYQTRYLGPYETMVNSQFNSVFFPSGTFSARALSANRYQSLNYYEVRHDKTVGPSGFVWSLDAYQTQTNPQFILAPLDILGNSEDMNVSFKYPVIRSRKKNLYLLGQFDYMNSQSIALNALLFKDPVRDLMLTLQYNELRFQGETSLMFAVDKGFAMWGASKRSLIPRSRLGATPDFIKGNFLLSRTQILNERFSIYGLINGQLTNNILLASETMTYGGPFIGRGYDMGQFIGDSGLSGKIEGRINFNPDLAFLKQAQFYSFYDLGELWSHIPQVPEYGGASAGVGMRAALTTFLNLEGFVARPLTTPNATQVVLGKNGKRFLGFFQVTAYL